MIKLTLSTPSGEIYTNDNVRFVVVHTDKGEFGVLKDHVPVLSTISQGYIKIESAKEVIYVSLISGIFEFSSNVCNIISNVAVYDKTLEKSNEKLKNLQNELNLKNKTVNKQFLANELELKKAIKLARAGKR